MLTCSEGIEERLAGVEDAVVELTGTALAGIRSARAAAAIPEDLWEHEPGLQRTVDDLHMLIGQLRMAEMMIQAMRDTAARARWAL